MWNEYKKPMWSDGCFRDRLWLNDYERQHCCFGEGEDAAAGTGSVAYGLDPDEAGYFAATEQMFKDDTWNKNDPLTFEQWSEKREATHAANRAAAEKEAAAAAAPPVTGLAAQARNKEATQQQIRDDLQFDWDHPFGAYPAGVIPWQADSPAISRAEQMAIQDAEETAAMMNLDVNVEIDPVSRELSFSGPDALSFATGQFGKGIADFAKTVGKGSAAMALGSSFHDHLLTMLAPDYSMFKTGMDYLFPETAKDLQAQANARATEQQRLEDVENITDKSYLDEQLDKFSTAQREQAELDQQINEYASQQASGGEDNTIRTVSHTPPVVPLAPVYASDKKFLTPTRLRGPRVPEASYKLPISFEKFKANYLSENPGASLNRISSEYRKFLAESTPSGLETLTV